METPSSVRLVLGPIALGFCVLGCGSTDPGATSASGGQTSHSTGGQTNPGTGGQSNPGTGGQNHGTGGQSPGTGGQGNSGTGGLPPGPDGGTPGTGGATSDQPYLPWTEGNTWTYQVTVMGVTSTKITTVGVLEAVGGVGPNSAVMANHVVTSKMDGTDKSESWQAIEGDSVVRYREESFSAATGMLTLDTYWAPHKLHFDESAAHTALNANWTESYDETELPVGMAPLTGAKQDQWTVIGTDRMVTVPAGTFSTIALQKLSAAMVTKTYYYARGVGKVKEEGAGTEELVSYQIAP